MSFKVGDEVVCVDGSIFINGTRPLIKGAHYIISDINVCICGMQSLFVGITNKFGTECVCNTLIDSNNKWFMASIKFRKVERKKEVQYVKQEIEIKEPILN